MTEPPAAGSRMTVWSIATPRQNGLHLNSTPLRSSPSPSHYAIQSYRAVCLSQPLGPLTNTVGPPVTLEIRSYSTT